MAHEWTEHVVYNPPIDKLATVQHSADGTQQVPLQMQSGYQSAKPSLPLQPSKPRINSPPPHKTSFSQTAKEFRRSQQHTRVSAAKQQSVRPLTSEKMVRVPNTLIMDCNQILTQSKRRSLQNIRKIYSINQQCKTKRQFGSLKLEIANTSHALTIKKTERHPTPKLQNYILPKQTKPHPLDQFVGLTPSQPTNNNNNCLPMQAQLNAKLTLLGDLASEERDRHLLRIRQLIFRERQKCPSAPPNFQTYLINHYLVSQLMSKISQDLSALQLKKRNSEILTYIKNQMIAQIIHEENFGKITKDIHLYLRQPNYRETEYRGLTQLPKGQRMLTRASRNRHSKMQNKMDMEVGVQFGLGKKKQTDITAQFEQISQKTEQAIAQALAQLHIRATHKNNGVSKAEADNHIL